MTTEQTQSPSTEAADIAPPKFKVASKWKSSTPLRLMGVVMLGVVGFVVWTLLSGSKAPPSAGVVNIDVPTPPNISSVAGSSKSTPVYDAAVAADDAARIEAARKAGKSVQPTLSSSDRLNEEGERANKNIATAAPGAQRAVAVAEVAPQQPTADGSAAVATLMAEQLGRMVADWKRPLTGGGSVVASPALAQVTATTAATTTAPAAAKTRRIAAGTRLVARLNDEVVSTRLGYPVTATVLAGEFAGATLLSSTQRASADRLGVTFDTFVPPNASKSVAIVAEAVDVNGKGGGVASDVDRHLIASVVGTALTVGFGAYAQGLQRTQQTAVSSGNGGTAVADSGFDRARARDFAIAQSGSAVTAPIAAAGAKPNTVTAESGMIIGVTFRADVEIPFF